jgi:hypothetical protein
MNGISHLLSGTDALPHFLWTIETASRELAEEFSALANSGDFWSIAPAGTRPERLIEFRRGGLFPSGATYISGGRQITEVSIHGAELAAVITHQAAKLPKPVLLLHEPYLKKDNASEIARELTSIGTTLYKIVDIKKSTAASLTHDLAQFTVSWHALFILVNQEQISPDLRIIQTAELIAVGAYDVESYLYWVKQTLPGS